MPSIHSPLSKRIYFSSLIEKEAEEKTRFTTPNEKTSFKKKTRDIITNIEKGNLEPIFQQVEPRLKIVKGQPYIALGEVEIIPTDTFHKENNGEKYNYFICLGTLEKSITTNVLYQSLQIIPSEKSKKETFIDQRRWNKLIHRFKPAKHLQDMKALNERLASIYQKLPVEP